MDSDEIVDRLGLTPGTCGYMGTTYEGPHGAALYFLITPDHPGRVHHLDADQMYHFYDGAPLDVVFLTADGPVMHTLGHLGEDGGQPQLLVPAGTTHGSRTHGPFTLAVTTSFSDTRPVETDPTPEQRELATTLGFAV